jgi:hypothetical protein
MVVFDIASILQAILSFGSSLRSTYLGIVSGEMKSS